MILFHDPFIISQAENAIPMTPIAFTVFATLEGPNAFTVLAALLGVMIMENYYK